ncbi:MAG: DEAD/DEAH box helicase [Bacillota bacterium]
MVINQLNKLLAVEELDNYWQKKDFNLLPHQSQTVSKVINQMDGRALLADEVGLGKTIEAGLILKEYLLREVVETCLILTPASLGFQWWRELNNKFKIDLYNNRNGTGWHYFNIIIASLDKAKRNPHRQEIYERGFDLVIVDEAHRLKNRETMNWKFVNDIPKEYLLLLTATPLQNDLEELYNLISLLRPELYNNYNHFKQDHVRGKQQVKNLEQLQDQLSQLMIRNKRKNVRLNQDNDRELELIPVELGIAEQQLYERITDLIQEKQQGSLQGSSFQLLNLQREVCSSSFAVVKSLQRMLDKDRYQGIKDDLEELLEFANQIANNEKMKVVEEIMSASDGKVIIFTEYKATQEYIGYYLQQEGYTPVLFSGDLSDNQKEWAKNTFSQQGDVLVSTEAGAQGINLQFCNIIINYDLPWNPMKLEQRIGRVDRLGQANNVVVYNLITASTVEEKILNLLLQKTNLFEAVTGDQLQLLVNNQDNNIVDALGHSNSELSKLQNNYFH